MLKKLITIINRCLLKYIVILFTILSIPFGPKLVLIALATAKNEENLLIIYEVINKINAYLTRTINLALS